MARLFCEGTRKGNLENLSAVNLSLMASTKNDSNQTSSALD